MTPAPMRNYSKYPPLSENNVISESIAESTSGVWSMNT